MASIENAALHVSTDPDVNRVTIIAECDVRLTEFEVNAVNVLRLQYRIACSVLNRDLQYEDTSRRCAQPP